MQNQTFLKQELQRYEQLLDKAHTWGTGGTSTSNSKLVQGSSQSIEGIGIWNDSESEESGAETSKLGDSGALPLAFTKRTTSGTIVRQTKIEGFFKR